MEELVFKKLELSESECKMFEKLKNNYSITNKLFYKNNDLYSIKIIYKNNDIYYQLKENRKIIRETKNVNVIKSKLIKIMEN